ncbi:MAG: M20/M25/M40 family metallo-hydrolase [Chloroflexota bacterium]
MDYNILLNDTVNFAQRLIQTPSMSKEEAQIAELVAQECRDLGFDEVWIDEIGNVNGRVFGQNPELGAIVLNTHLDHVDPGEPSLWSVSPFAGVVENGRLIGRGASDIKGPMAVQVYSLAALLRNGERPKRDVVFTGVVQEEIGGAGARHWIKHLDYKVDLVVLGEPSDNQIALGHRGLGQFLVTFNGRSVHASVPQKGDNPNYKLAQFLLNLQSAQSQLSSHEILGATTVAPTIVHVDTKSRNVTPAWTQIVVDFRTASESINSLTEFIHEMAGETNIIVEPIGHVPPESEWGKIIFGYYSPPESGFVQRSRQIIETGMGRETTFSSYSFGTDGRHFVADGLPIIGYGPSLESQAHVVDEYVNLDKMLESLKGHVALLREF